MERTAYPVVVIGAGPVGLAAAAHLLERGVEPLVLERGDQVGASIASWGHVRLFTPWRYATDAAAERLLGDTGWETPDPESFPTGAELVNRYLEPLARHPRLQPSIRLGAEAVGVTRAGLDKMTTPGREDAPFLVTVRDARGEDSTQLAQAVIDASGTWTRPNPLGAAGRPAIGELAAQERIAYGIPDVLGSARERYAGKRVLVVGSGHSAFNALLDLVDLAAEAPGTTITWAIRKPAAQTGILFGGGINDALPARGELGARVRALVERGQLRMVTGLRIARIETTADGLVVSGDDTVLDPVDEIIGATGFRPALDLLSEVRLALDPAVEAPTALAPLIDPNLHSCGSVP
ncbi:MAG: FAD-dependent oxidoreductase, partial [Thermomicrobiales bacterium]